MHYRQSLRRAPRAFGAIALASALLCLMPCVLVEAALAQEVSDETRRQSPAQQRPRRVGSRPRGEMPEPVEKPSAGGTRSGAEEVGEDDVVRVETQLVPVPVTVRDRTGRPLAGLRADNFIIYEDGRPQRVSNFATTDAPFEVALLLDTSGSTRAELGLVRRAANLFIDALRPGDRVSIVAFNTAEDGIEKRAVVEVKTLLTSDRELLREALDQLGASNGTPFYDALERVVKEVFREQPRESELRGRRALVALTDGVDSTSDAEFNEVRAEFLRAGALSYFIQVNTEDYVEDRLMRDCADDGRLSLSRVQLQRYRRLFNPSAEVADYASFCQLGPIERMHISRQLYRLAQQEMNDLARASGGKTFTALDLRDARQAFAQVAADIGKQYSLGYYSTNKARDGSFRKIRVELRGVPGAQVNAREGYQAPKT
ncbi:MAG: VWA domain-containing protein [Pyrinomonadaceae bacterium]